MLKDRADVFHDDTEPVALVALHLGAFQEGRYQSLLIDNTFPREDRILLQFRDLQQGVLLKGPLLCHLSADIGGGLRNGFDEIRIQVDLMLNDGQ